MSGQKTAPGRAARAPWHVRFFSRILALFLNVGIPLGFNRLVTIRGRKSGTPRTTPLAVIEVEGRRWVWAPWGEVQWVRNLRATGSASVNDRGRTLEMRATELDAPGRVSFFLRPLARSIPLGVLFIRVADGVDLNRPATEAAEGRVVFELHPVR